MEALANAAKVASIKREHTPEQHRKVQAATARLQSGQNYPSMKLIRCRDGMFHKAMLDIACQMTVQPATVTAADVDFMQLDVGCGTNDVH
jgi:hypothetical protein